MGEVDRVSFLKVGKKGRSQFLIENIFIKFKYSNIFNNAVQF